jgi:uncharacterized RDD family membrane protein YckC
METRVAMLPLYHIANPARFASLLRRRLIVELPSRSDSMSCPSCGSTLRDDARICLACGEVIRARVAAGERLAPAAAGVPAWIAFEDRPREEVVYGAGRPARVLAAIIDGLILGGFGWAVTVLSGTAAVDADLHGNVTVHWWVLAPILVVQALYYSAFPASALQGTPGKKLLGLRITDLDDQRLTIFQSALRYVFQKSWLLVVIPLTFIGVSNSPYAALLPLVAVIAMGVAFWMLCANGRSPWDWMAGTKVVE